MGARTGERPAAPVGEPRRPGEARGALVPLLPVAAGLLAFFASVYAVRGYRFPVGPDVPFYVWSTQAAGELGLSVTRLRPGMHALILTVASTTGLSVTAATGALAVALASAVGLAASALTERGLGADRIRVPAAGVVTGAFAARLASGFLANLLFAALFLAALAVLVVRDGAPRAPAATALAAALLAAGVVTHPAFALFGAMVLAGAVLLRLRPLAGPGAREDASATVRAAGAATVVSAAALGGTAVGAGQDAVHASRDALLRAAGLGRLLREAFASRWADSARAFLLPVTGPLGAIGAWVAARAAGDRRGRRPAAGWFAAVAASWAIVSLVAAVVALSTGVAPAGRVLAFALVLPLLSAIGALALGRLVARASRTVGLLLPALLLAVLLLAPLAAWLREHPFTSGEDLAAVTAAARVADRLPAATPLVFLIDHDGPHPGVELARYGNVIRMGLPPARALDARFFVGGPADLAGRTPRLSGDEEHDAAARLLAGEAIAVLERGSAVFLLQPFNREGWSPEAGAPIGPGARLLEPTEPPGLGGRPAASDLPDLGTLPPWGTPAAAAGLLLVLAATGLGWALALAGGSFASRVALSPAIGAGALVAASVAADLAGLRLAGAGGVAATAVAAGAGWLAWAIRSRAASARATGRGDRSASG